MSLSERTKSRIALGIAAAGILLLGVLLWLQAPVAGAQAGSPSPGPTYSQQEIAAGRELFVTNCASCHGEDARGTAAAPNLVGVGAAAVDFMLRTGRMPAAVADPDETAVRKPPVLNQHQIEQLTAYVASLAPGPPIPTVDLSHADVSRGEQLFLDNCAQCHGATGAGGTLYSTIVPTLHQSEPIDVAEAVITGPGQMPKFSFTQQERDDLALFVRHIQTAQDQGGLDIGAVGPVTEGYVSWAIGLGVVILMVLIIGRHQARATGEVKEEPLDES